MVGLIRVAGFLLSLLALAGVAQAGRELRLRVPLQPEAAEIAQLEGELPLTLWLPDGQGPFPLALIHHERRFFNEGLPRYEAATRYFLARGYAVALPQRVGYGELSAAGDREFINCYRPNPGRVLTGAALQAAAVLEGLSRLGQPIDRKRVLHVGVGVGGLSALATAHSSPQGAQAAINFGGVLGAYPERFPGQPCGVEATRQLLTQLGRSARLQAESGGQALPTLWLYASNDKHVLPQHAKRWHAGYRRGGGRSQFELLEAWGDDGNQLFAQGVERWQELLDRFLATTSLPATPAAAKPS